MSRKEKYRETDNMTEEQKRERRVRKTCFTMLGIAMILLGLLGFLWFILETSGAVGDGSEFPPIWLIFVSFSLFLGGILVTIFTWVSFFPYTKIKVYPKRSVVVKCEYCGIEYNKYLKKCTHCTAPNSYYIDRQEKSKIEIKKVENK